MDKSPLLTIGMATYDDYEGVWSTIQALKLYHDLSRVQLLVVNNNPDSPAGQKIERFCHKAGVLHYPYTDKTGTSVRNKVFDCAETPFVCCVDSHVLFLPGSVDNLLAYLDANPTTDDLIHGPLMSTNLKTVMATHMVPIWGDNMLGKWRNTQPLPTEPFEIPMMGLGLFVARKATWLRFNEHFKGFGGEEGYIHDKYRQNGRKVVCVPTLKWDHRWGYPVRPPYKLEQRDMIFNYFVGYIELGKNTTELYDVFSRFGRTTLENIHADAEFVMSGQRNIIVFGVGHSGTSVVSQMLNILGYETGVNDFFEHDELVRLNNMLIPKLRANQCTRGIRQQASAWLSKLPKPWAIKDPRMVLTLKWWQRVINPLPVLIHLVRDKDKTKKSYVKRGETRPDGTPAVYGHTVDELFDFADRQYAQYPGPKVQISFDKLAEAIKIFDPERALNEEPVH